MSVNVDQYPSLAMFGVTLPGDFLKSSKIHRGDSFQEVPVIGPASSLMKVASMVVILVGTLFLTISANAAKLISVIPGVSTLGTVLFLSYYDDGAMEVVKKFPEMITQGKPQQRYFAIRCSLSLLSLGALLIPVDLFFTFVYRPYAVCREFPSCSKKISTIR